MKKLFVLLLAVLLLFAGSAAADPVDLSGMTFDQLVALRDQLNLAIWNSQEWQEVTVPIGVWTVGEDIPAGHWTITMPENSSGNITYSDRLDEFGKGVPFGWLGFVETIDTHKNKDGSWRFPEDPQSVDLDMKAGMYFINSAPVIFTPYAGKPDLGFK